MSNQNAAPWTSIYQLGVAILCVAFACFMLTIRSALLTQRVDAMEQSPGCDCRDRDDGHRVPSIPHLPDTGDLPK